MMKLNNVEGRTTLAVFKDTSSLIEVYSVKGEIDTLFMSRIGDTYVEMERRGSESERYIREYMQAPREFLEVVSRLMNYISYDELKAVSLFKEREFDSYVSDLGDCVKYVIQDILIALHEYRDRVDVERLSDSNLGSFNSFIIDLFDTDSDFSVFVCRHLFENNISNNTVGNSSIIDFIPFGTKNTLIVPTTTFMFTASPILVDIPPFDYYNEDLTFSSLGKFTKLIMSKIYDEINRSKLGDYLVCGFESDRGHVFTPIKNNDDILNFDVYDNVACLAYKSKVEDSELILDVALWSECGYVYFKRARVRLSGVYSVKELQSPYEIYVVPLDEDGGYVNDDANEEFTEAIMYDIRMKLSQASFDDIANKDSAIMKSIKDKVVRIYTRNGYTEEDARKLIKY